MSTRKTVYLMQGVYFKENPFDDEMTEDIQDGKIDDLLSLVYVNPMSDSSIIVGHALSQMDDYAETDLLEVQGTDDVTRKKIGNDIREKLNLIDVKDDDVKNWLAGVWG